MARTTQQRRSRGGRNHHKPRQQLSEQTGAIDARSVSAPSSHAPRKTPAVQATKDEVIAAVHSLYEDHLKPYGRILRKRLVERFLAAGRSSVDVDAKHLRELCEACDALHTEPGEGGEWSTVLRHAQRTFVDLYSNADPYPEELWEALAAFFNGPEWAEASLPGGRYSCAQSLVDQKLGFLSGYSLGQVCHIVQLAISTRRVLGYLNGATVPYYRSQSMLKQSCAENQQACTAGPSAPGADTDTPELPFASWQTVREHVQHILEQAHAAGRDSISISNVKCLFRSECQVELSETKLGHHRVTDLFKDERFRGVCALQLHDQGYVLKAQQAAAKPVPATPLFDAESSTTEMLDQEVAARSEPRGVIFCPDEPLCLDDADSTSTPAAAKAMLVDALQTPATETPASQAAATPMFSPLTAFFGDGLQRRSTLQTSSSFSLFHAFAVSRETACTPNVQVTATPLPEAVESDADSPLVEALESQVVASPRVIFCPDEPLCLDDAESGSRPAMAGTLLQSPATRTPATQMAATPMFSPATAFFGDGQRTRALHASVPTSQPKLCAGVTDPLPISLDSLLFRRDSQAAGADAECGTGAKPEGQEVVLDDDQARPRSVVFCPDEPLRLDDEECDSAAAVAGAVAVEALQTPGIETPATQAAATPMFSPSTAFFGDGVQRRGSPPGLLPTACPGEALIAAAKQRAQLALSLGISPHSDGGVSMQRVPTAPYYAGGMPGSLPLQMPPCPAPTSYVDAR